MLDFSGKDVFIALKVWCGVVEGPGLTGVWWQSGEVVSSLWPQICKHTCTYTQKRLHYRDTPCYLSLFCWSKMAVSYHPQGYLCEFIDPVSNDYYWKKCTLVARKLTFINCCWNSYCCTLDLVVSYVMIHFISVLPKLPFKLHIHTNIYYLMNKFHVTKCD